MKKNSISNPFKPIASLLNRYNLVIFVVIVSGGLIAAVMILDNILTQPHVATNSTTVIAPTTTFDQQTISRLGKLETSANNTAYNNLPSGRINPFSE